MKFPFDTESVIETLVERPLVLSTNFASSSEFKMTNEVMLLPDGQVSGSSDRWEVIDGVLRLLSEKGHLVTEFRNLETRNGIVYVVGRNVLEPVNSTRRILHVKKTISSDFGVCIASNIHYEKLAVPRILRSLEGDGFDMSRVVVVVGNDKNDDQGSIDSSMKVMAVRRRADIFGLTALGNVPEGVACTKPYWLLLHDTCEVTNGFAASISKIDVGLNPDMVMFRPLGEKVEFGLYASQFAKKMGDMPIGTKPFDYFNLMTPKAGIIMVMDTPLKKEPERDVYGKGIRRETIVFPALNIRKYRSKASDTKRP